MIRIFKKFFVLIFLELYILKAGAFNIELAHRTSSNTQLYITSYAGEKKLIVDLPKYEQDYYGELYVEQKKDIVSISFPGQDNKKSYMKYFNLSTGKASPTFVSDGIMENYKQEVVSTYEKNKNTYFVAPMFESCKMPLAYPVHFKTTAFYPDSKFLSNGDLYISVEKLPSKNEYQITVPVNYEKLYKDCRG